MFNWNQYKMKMHLGSKLKKERERKKTEIKKKPLDSKF
jgi:hypothetical protein